MRVLGPKFLFFNTFYGYVFACLAYDDLYGRNFPSLPFKIVDANARMEGVKFSLNLKITIVPLKVFLQRRLKLGGGKERSGRTH